MEFMHLLNKIKHISYPDCFAFRLTAGPFAHVGTARLLAPRDHAVDAAVATDPPGSEPARCKSVAILQRFGDECFLGEDPWWLVDFWIFLVNTGIIMCNIMCNIICWIFVEHILKLRLEKSRIRCFSEDAGDPFAQDSFDLSLPHQR